MKSNEEHFTMTTFDVDSHTTVCFDSNVYSTIEVAISYNLVN